MIEYQVFSESGGMTEKAVLNTQTRARERARDFANRADHGLVMNVTESSLVLPLTNRNLCVVTVWYRKD